MRQSVVFDARQIIINVQPRQPIRETKMDRRCDVAGAIDRSVMYRHHVPMFRVDAFGPHQRSTIGAKSPAKLFGCRNVAGRALDDLKPCPKRIDPRNHRCASGAPADAAMTVAGVEHVDKSIADRSAKAATQEIASIKHVTPGCAEPAEVEDDALYRATRSPGCYRSQCLERCRHAADDDDE